MCRARPRAVRAPAAGPLKPGPSRALQVSLVGLRARLALNEAGGRGPLAAAFCSATCVETSKNNGKKNQCFFRKGEYATSPSCDLRLTAICTVSSPIRHPHPRQLTSCPFGIDLPCAPTAATFDTTTPLRSASTPLRLPSTNRHPLAHPPSGRTSQ
jgi:hypothetical protein